jgi:hypothetical protein
MLTALEIKLKQVELSQPNESLIKDQINKGEALILDAIKTQGRKYVCVDGSDLCFREREQLKDCGYYVTEINNYKVLVSWEIGLK